MKKFIPILFSTFMVKALMEGRKTMTRRIINPQPEDGLHNHTLLPMALESTLEGWHGTVDNTGESKEFKCRYGNVGDVLYVKETFFIHERDDIYHYKADYNDNIKREWKPSIHMPAKAARIFLEVTNVRVERLQDINEEDAIAEGIEGEPTGDHLFKNYLSSHNGNMKRAKRHSNYKYISAYESFSSLWQMINGNESWNANPWVWVVEFKKIEKPEAWDKYLQSLSLRPLIKAVEKKTGEKVKYVTGHFNTAI